MGTVSHHTHTDHQHEGCSCRSTFGCRCQRSSLELLYNNKQCRSLPRLHWVQCRLLTSDLQCRLRSSDLRCCCRPRCCPRIRCQDPRCNPHRTPPSWSWLRISPHQPCSCPRNTINCAIRCGPGQRLDLETSLALSKH